MTTPSSLLRKPQWTKLIGGPAYKARRVIIMDHYPCPKPGQPLPPMRQQLWIGSTDRDDIMPKCRVWLDGAMAFRVGSGSEAVLVSGQATRERFGRESGWCEGRG